jgi:hypothetical protein
MKCIEVRENLNLFLDGEIDLSAQENIKTHLENCIACETEFDNLETISESLKQTLPIATNALLDEKMLDAFESFHADKQTVTEEKQEEKIGWFGIPRIAFATALVLLALVGGSAFQLGRISVSRIEIATPAKREDFRELPNEKLENSTVAQNDSVEKSPEIKIVEVPVIQEKIVKLPVIKEKIITRKIYVKEQKKEIKENVIRPKFNRNDEVAMKSSIQENGFVTQTNLKGFQPTTDLKIKITKKEEE